METVDADWNLGAAWVPVEDLAQSDARIKVLFDEGKTYIQIGTTIGRTARYVGTRLVSMRRRGEVGRRPPANTNPHNGRM